MKILTLATAAVLALTALPAAAQTYHSDTRQWRQHERIDRGVRSGRLTPDEARRLARQQNRVERIERRARAYNNGYIDPRSQRRIETIQDRADNRIRRLNRNDHRWW